MPGLTAPGQNINISLVTSDPAWQAVKRADPLQHKGGFKALHSHVLNTAMADLAGRYSKVWIWKYAPGTDNQSRHR